VEGRELALGAIELRVFVRIAVGAGEAGARGSANRILKREVLAVAGGGLVGEVDAAVADWSF
jgi:hypothetical protein